MADDIVEKILAGAALRCVMQPDDEIPTNSPLHDECFDLPHIIVDGDKFSAVTHRELVTNPLSELPVVFFYTNYQEMFGSFSPIQGQPGMGGDNLLSTNFAPRKRYKTFAWLCNKNWRKIWDSNGEQDIRALRLAVRQASPLKAAFLDQENIWNIHPVLLPQIVRDADAFVLQTGYLAYPQFFRSTREIEEYILANDQCRAYFTEEKLCFVKKNLVKSTVFHAFYHLYHDGSYKSYYDLARGDTINQYQRLIVFAAE